MVVCNAGLEQLGYKVKEEECIITNIPDDQVIAIPSEHPSGYPTRWQSPNNAWCREMVEAYEFDSDSDSNSELT